MRKNQYKSAQKNSFSLNKIKRGICILGVDEAGRGAWAGPVVAACVSWSGKNPIKSLLRDSKKMTAANREKTYEEIVQLAKQQKLSYGIGSIDNTIIDMVGIREANRRAMELALQNLQKITAKQSESMLLLIDGRDNYVFHLPDLPKPEYIIRGDSLVPQIMAASILAKVTRDRWMIDSEKRFPGYGFARHKGYGTMIHQKALKQLGVSQIHRKSYQPIKTLLGD